MATSENGGVNVIGQAPSEPDTYQQIRDDLESLVGDFQNVEGGLQCVVIREAETCGGDLDKDFVAALFSFRELLTVLNDRGDALVDRMMELERSAQNADNVGGR